MYLRKIIIIIKNVAKNTKSPKLCLGDLKIEKKCNENLLHI